MVVTRSHGDNAEQQEELRRIELERTRRTAMNPPASPTMPSGTDRLSPREPVTEPTAVASTIHGTTSAYLPPPPSSHRSSTSATARLRLAELEAAEKLAELKRKEIQLEADLIRKRLAVQVASIRDNESVIEEPLPVTDNRRVSEWLQSNEVPQRGEVTERGETIERGDLPLPEPSARVHFDEQAATLHEHRQPTTRAANHKTDIEQLTEVLSNMTRGRGPSRQATELPIFTGAPNEWLPFQAAVRDSTQLYHFTPTENLARLRVCLRGEARDTVSALLHTATHPDAIMKTLRQCYGRPEIIVDRTMEELRRLPRPTANASDLNAFAIKVQNCVTVLQSVDRKSYLHNPLLTREIIEKLSPHLRSRWCDYASEHTNNDEPEVINLSHFLMREADLALRYTYLSAATNTPTAGKNVNNSGTTRKNERTRTRGSAVYAAAEEERKSQATTCPCCGANHDINTCRKLRDMNIDERWAWAKSAHVCFKCIQQKHRRNTCRASVCGVNNCRRPHHPLLHDNEARTTPLNENEPASASTSTNEEAVMSIATTAKDRTVILKVCNVVISGPAGQVTTHALLDEGSTVTLIDKELADQVGATGTPAPLILRGVNATEEQNDSQRVAINIRGRDEANTHKITARTIRNLSLRQQHVPRDLTRYAHLRHLEGACYNNAKPRVLIGADNWHLIVSRQLRAGRKNEPAASLTDLGWVIYGTAPRLLHRNEDTTLHIQATERRHETTPNESDSDESLHQLVKQHCAERAVKEVIEVQARANFTLRGWNSNCTRLLNAIPDNLRAQAPTSLCSKEAQNKTLGMLWDATNDELGFNTTLARIPESVRKRERAPTKREALAATMSLFDPLGLLSSYTITMKIILQDIWRIQLGWDEPLPDEYAERVDRWLEELSNIARLRVPRMYGAVKNEEPARELHVFVDASELAYSAAAYWRLQYSDGHIVVTLAAAKAKVAPLRPLTIPRLELQAAVIGARLADVIKREHRWEAERITYWSDSSTVLQWIRTDARRYTPYVAHRLGEIAELSDAEQWRWVPTSQNVADDATRGNHTPKNSQDRWFTGPAFLYEAEETWPRPHNTGVGGNEIEVAHHTYETGGENILPDISRFSSYERLMRATATALAFIDKCRKLATRLELHHLERAERLWIARAQEESFGRDITRLRAGHALPATSRLRKLDPVIEDGLLRLRGRVNAAQIATSAKRPLLMDGRHPLTRLIVSREHAAAGHASNERVLNDLRQRYWMLRARPTLRTVVRQCALCQVRRAKPRVPPTGDLPPARLDALHRPFTNCGIDYFGPLLVKIGRRREKRWGALFTCLTTRAVHIEIVNSLTTDSAIMALRRMAARRGWPRQIWSDNGTNFRGADAELRAAYQEWIPELRTYAQLQRTDWRFIPPGAPNQGGAWERLIRSVKIALSATLKEQVPKEEVLHTLLLEAEHSVNARPLTHVTMDPRDEEALTPNHFLIGTSSGLPQTGPCDAADKRTWRAAQGLADRFWRRWVHEYLPTLVPRGHPRDHQQPLQEGDLVLVVDPALPRNTWPRGIIERVYVGPDGDVRSADVRTRGGTLRRPTRKLAVLPVKEEATQASPGGECYGQRARRRSGETTASSGAV